MRKLLPPLSPLALLALLALLIAGCFTGGATETETGTAQITGEVKWADGRPAVGARVRLRPVDFRADSMPAPVSGGRVVGDTVTDDKGRYAFDKVKAGEYQVEALYSEGYGDVARFKVESESKPLKLAVMVLKSIVSVTGRVTYSDSSLAPAKVQVLGTEHWALADSATGRFTLREMPPGTFDLRVSTPLPFFAAKDFPGVVVAGPASVDVGDLVLVKGEKQPYAVTGGKLTLAGLDGSNPVVYDNDWAYNTWDNEFVWALASSGKIDLRGNIASSVPRDTGALDPVFFSTWTEEARRCRLAGMRNIPEPILGSNRKLILPPSGRWQDIVPESNAGVALLLSEARKASAAKPLVVLAAGALTTVAQALLLDPYIADRMVIFGIYNHSLNGRDSLASYLVARKARFVEWGRDYLWAGPGPSASAVAGNRLGLELKANRDTTTIPALFFADISALPFLLDGQAWKTARSATVLAPPLNVSLVASGPYDFIDIPQEANDWALMDKLFFAALADSAAYHPWAVPGTVASVSFRALTGAVLDSIAGEGEIVSGLGPGDWVEYALDAAAEGDYDVTLRYRCTARATAQMTGREAASRADLDVPAGPTWTVTKVRLRLAKGVQKVRIATSGGAWELGRLTWEAVP